MGSKPQPSERLPQPEPPAICSNFILQLRLLDMPDVPADDAEHNGWHPLLHLTALQACHRRC